MWIRAGKWNRREGEADDSEGGARTRGVGNEGTMDRKNPKKLTFECWKGRTEVSWPYVWTECYLRRVTLARRAEAWEGRGDDQYDDAILQRQLGISLGR